MLIMKHKFVILTKGLICLLLLKMLACSSEQDMVIIDDSYGVLGKTNAPVSFEIKLNKHQKSRAEEWRIGLLDLSAGSGKESLIPVQIEDVGKGSNSRAVMIMPDGEPGLRRFKLVESESFLNESIQANRDPESGQVMISEEDKNILQYNYQTIYEKDVIRSDNEKLEKHIRTETDTFVTVSIYAVPRSNYIHPLYGLEGEMLTRDWPEGAHPHHRAIYWAWPEVEYGSERGDIHALQRVFARPTGRIEFISGPVFAQIIAENLWMWEDTEPVVREHAVIRIYRSISKTRVIDLTFRFDALVDSITIAKRDTKLYGGLNLRMQSPEEQDISYFTDQPGSKPLRAWSDLNGIFEVGKSPSGLMVLQHQGNPDYPGDWVEYPDLAWVQPTFPAPGTRYPLSMEESLILRYRLIVYTGGKPGVDISKKRWDAYHENAAPVYSFQSYED